MHRIGRAVVLALALPSAVAAAPGPSPAATLLLPYFEVDLEAFTGPTTLFSVNNAGEQSTVAHVVVWTDWGIPSYSFDVVLAPRDVATFNLRDLFHSGVVPPSDGTAVSGCGDPVARPPLDAAALDTLRRRHTGQPQAPGSVLCAGSGRLGPTVATGYVTVDAARTCAGEETFFPGDEGYFSAGAGWATPFATRDDVLWGDVFQLAAADDSAQGMPLVHVPIDDEAIETFYRQLVPDGADGRAMLGSRYRGRFLSGGAIDGGTDLLVWLENTLGTEPVQCDTRANLGDACQGADILLYDETTAPAGAGSLHRGEIAALRVPIGGAEIPATAASGMFELRHLVVIGCFVLPIGSQPLQAWVTPVMKAEGRYSIGTDPVRLPD